MLLNARRRHRQVHLSNSARAASTGVCSTPEGVIVKFTRRAVEDAAELALLNARRRHRQVHSRPMTTQTQNQACSTPEGVIVKFTKQGAGTRCLSYPAQRPKASSSSSRTAAAPAAVALLLLNARRRHRQVHGRDDRVASAFVNCSTPEGVIVKFTLLTKLAKESILACSTPEGVIVKFTASSAVEH